MDFRMKNMMDTMRKPTDLEDQYQKIRNIPPLLICNQNNAEKINKNLIYNSELLKNNGIEDPSKDIDFSCVKGNYNDKIYSRNIPGSNLPVNIDMRPLPASKCSTLYSNRDFEKEREGLEKFNVYEVNSNCIDEGFMPGKGTVSRYFDNIDLESDLKTINQIDTKCTKRLFKISPEQKTSKLHCYKDVLAKDYELCDRTHGYRWCDYNKCSNLEQFPTCESKKFTCELNKEGRSNAEKLHKKDILVSDNYNIKKSSGQLVNRNKLNEALVDMKLMDKKRQVAIDNYLKKDNIKYKDQPYPHPADITQFKSDGSSNIYAPMIRHQSIIEEDAFNLGYEKGLDKNIEQRVKRKANQKLNDIHINRTANLRANRPSEPPEPPTICSYGNNIKSIYDIDLMKYQCRGQTKNLYKFHNLVQEDSDCLFCEQVFNNQTKRKHISVGRHQEYKRS